MSTTALPTAPPTAPLTAPPPRPLCRLKEHQIVENYVLDRLCALGYRLHKEGCYRPASDGSGHYTHAWERVCDVKEFIACEVTQERCYPVYMAYTSSGSYSLNSRLAEFLCIGSVQSRFKRLKLNRHLLIFPVITQLLYTKCRKRRR